MTIGLTGIAAAIIDLDGTLLDTAPDIRVAINSMRNELDLAPLELDIVVNFIGRGSECLIHGILSLDFPPEEMERHFDQALASYQKHYHHINGDHAVLYPEVHEGLQALQAKGLRLACVTNKPIALALPLLEKTGLRNFFSVVYGGDSLAKKKPDPLPLRQVCIDFDLPPQQVAVIGDSSNDAQAARAAGCPIFIVPYGYNHGEPVQNIDSDGIVPTLLAAANVIFA